uniref:Uncharacterized protein n=1 Tax=Timema shepardi TaxID=629360 RepID=A0A7R9ARB9_TIMSH|nr:unnamed protein product [Timema shepardi]
MTITASQYGKLRRSASFSKLRASLRRSSAKLMQKLTNRGASTIEGYSNRYAALHSLYVSISARSKNLFYQLI